MIVKNDKKSESMGSLPSVSSVAGSDKSMSQGGRQPLDASRKMNHPSAGGKDKGLQRPPAMLSEIVEEKKSDRSSRKSDSDRKHLQSKRESISKKHENPVESLD